jgi:hypothetical protein
MGDPRQQNLQSSALGAKLDYISGIQYDDVLLRALAIIARLSVRQAVRTHIESGTHLTPSDQLRQPRKSSSNSGSTLSHGSL